LAQRYVISRVIADISSATPGIAKGSGFQIIAINKAIKDGKKIIGIEANRLITIGGRALRNRRYDYIEEVNGVVTNVECKSWIPSAVASRIRASLKGTDVHGEQLMVDLLDFNRKELSGVRWEFDSEEAAEIARAAMMHTLRNDKEIRKTMTEHIGGDIKYKKFIDLLDDELTTFITVVK